MSWGAAHPRAGRRLTLESQWALICLRGRGLTAWITPLIAHRTRRRIDEWMPERIADAVTPAIRGGWPPWIPPLSAKPNTRTFELAISPDASLRALGLKQIEDDRTFYYQKLRWRWWQERGVEY